MQDYSNLKSKRHKDNKKTKPPNMFIKVKNLTGRVIDLDVDTDDSIQQVKEKLEEKEGIPPDQQRLIFSGRAMADDRKLSSYNVVSGNTLHLVLALRGGAHQIKILESLESLPPLPKMNESMNELLVFSSFIK